MKKLLLSLMMVLGALSAGAKEYILTPSAATTIDPAAADANQYDASATSWLVSQGAISGTSLKSYSLKYLIFQMDLKDLEGMTIQKAEMSYDSKCTVSGKNSNVILTSINPAWSVSTVTWNSLNADAKAVQISTGTGQNVKTSTVNLKENVLNYVKDEAGKTVAFAIYTYTAREQQISNIKLTIDAIDASASVDVKVKYMCGDTEVKTATTIGTKEQAVELSTEEKANFVLDGKKYIYVSDNGASVTAAEGAEVIVTVREAAAYLWHVMSSQGGEVAKGVGFEGDVVEAGYPRYQRNELTNVLYEAPKTNDSKKRYTVNVPLTEDNAKVEMAYNQVKEDIVFYKEAENIDGLTEVTYGNVFVRASNALAAKATTDTKITTIPAGKYKVYAGVFSSAKTPAYVIKIGVGDNVFEAPVTAVNNSEVASDEIVLNSSADVVLKAEGMGDNNALDYLYIEKTGDVELVNTITAGTYEVHGTIVADEGKVIPAALQKYATAEGYTAKAELAGEANKLTITSEEGLLNGFDVAGDAVEFAADKTFTIEGYTFTVGKDGKTAGSLAMTQTEAGYSLENAEIYYNGVKVGIVKDITLEAIEEAEYTVNPVITAEYMKNTMKREIEEQNVTVTKKGDVYSTVIPAATASGENATINMEATLIKNLVMTPSEEDPDSLVITLKEGSETQTIAFAGEIKVNMMGREIKTPISGSADIESVLGYLYGEKLYLAVNSSFNIMGQTGTLSVVYNPIHATALAVADFEDIEVAEESVKYFESENPTETPVVDWKSGDYTFSTYTSDWGAMGKYYYSYAVSSKTTTDGKLNDYALESACGGAKSGKNYAVWYDNSYNGGDSIVLSKAAVVSGLYITNTTTVVDAILNGDGMSTVEGGFQNGDAYTVTFTGYYKGEKTGDKEFKLAYGQNNVIYYAEDWKWVDLMALGTVDYIKVTVDSTKRNTWGSTTPSYFCIDDLGGVAPETDAEYATKDIPTANDTVKVQNTSIRNGKFMKDNKVIIINNGKMYNVIGQ